MHQSLAVGVVVQLLQEPDWVATFTASKAVAIVFCRRHDERRGALVVKRAQAFVVCSGAVQTHIVSHNINYVGSVSDLFNSCLVNHRVNAYSKQYAKLRNFCHIRVMVAKEYEGLWLNKSIKKTKTNPGDVLASPGILLHHRRCFDYQALFSVCKIAACGDLLISINTGLREFECLEVACRCNHLHVVVVDKSHELVAFAVSFD